MLKNVFRRALVLGILGAMFASTPANALVQYVGTYDGDGADTALFNDRGLFDTAFGANPFADFRRFDTVRFQSLLLRFDISNLDPAVYNDAFLRLDIFHNRGRQLRVYGIGEGFDNWDEATTAYSNAPGVLQPSEGGPAYDSADGSAFQDFSELFLPPGNPPVPAAYPLGLIDIGDTRGQPTQRDVYVSNPGQLFLGDFLAADTDGVVSFLIHHDITHNSHIGNISTKERHPNWAPMLGVVPTNLIPEPSSYVLALLGMGAVGMLVRRR